MSPHHNRTFSRLCGVEVLVGLFLIGSGIFLSSLWYNANVHRLKQDENFTLRQWLGSQVLLVFLYAILPSLYLYRNMTAIYETAYKTEGVFQTVIGRIRHCPVSTLTAHHQNKDEDGPPDTANHDNDNLPSWKYTTKTNESGRVMGQWSLDVIIEYDIEIPRHWGDCADDDDQDEQDIEKRLFRLRHKETFGGFHPQVRYDHPPETPIPLSKAEHVELLVLQAFPACAQVKHPFHNIEIDTDDPNHNDQQTTPPISICRPCMQNWIGCTITVVLDVSLLVFAYLSYTILPYNGTKLETTRSLLTILAYHIVTYVPGCYCLDRVLVRLAEYAYMNRAKEVAPEQFELLRTDAMT